MNPEDAVANSSTLSSKADLYPDKRDSKSNHRAQFLEKKVLSQKEEETSDFLIHNSQLHILQAK